MDAIDRWQDGISTVIAEALFAQVLQRFRIQFFGHVYAPRNSVWVLGGQMLSMAYASRIDAH